MNAQARAGATAEQAAAPDTGDRPPAVVADAFTVGGSMADHMEPDEPVVAEAPAAEEAEPDEKPAAKYAKLPEATSDALPAWVKVPKGFRFPKGRKAVFVFFHDYLTDTPLHGNRQAILWPLDPEDEKQSFNRAMGDANRAPGELAKQMIRAVDGFAADWTGTPSQGSVDRFWREIGGKYRDLLVRVYAQLHVLTPEETADFFEHCIAVRSSG